MNHDMFGEYENNVQQSFDQLEDWPFNATNFTAEQLFDAAFQLFNTTAPTPFPLININNNNNTDYYSNSTGNTSSNVDDEHRLEHAPQLTKSALIKVYVLSTMAIISLLGNVLTMWNIYKTRIARRNSRHSWSAIYSLIFHLSIADVLVTGFCIIGEAAWCYTVKWLANELTCKLVKLLQMFSLYLSTYVLVLIGVDRWIAVKYPMKSLNMAKRCYRLLGGTYVLSFLLSLPQFFIFHVARGPFIEEFYQCVTHGFYTAVWQEQLYTSFTLIFTFLLPLFVLLITYMSTFRTISNSEKMFQGTRMPSYSSKPTQQTNRQRLIHKAKMKSLRISVVIIIAFLVCWTPYNVMMIMFMFWNPDKTVGEDLQSGIFFFGMSNSLVNPLIYGAFHLSPFKRKPSKTGNNNNQNSLNRLAANENGPDISPMDTVTLLKRVDSQRNASVLTAVTQIDSNGRQVRTYRQSSYYRSPSNGSNHMCSGNGASFSKEHIGLLDGSGTPITLRKSQRSSYPKQAADLFEPAVHHHQHPSSLLRSESRNSYQRPSGKSVVVSFDGARVTGSGLGAGLLAGNPAPVLNMQNLDIGNAAATTSAKFIGFNVPHDANGSKPTTIGFNVFLGDKNETVTSV